MKYIKLLILGLLLVTACSPNEEYKDYTIEKSPVSEMASDWWVIALEPDGVTPAYGGDYVLMTTYNTGDNDGKTMFIDDHQNFFEFKTKIDVNLSDKTFTGKDNVELYYDGEILLSNGSITKNSYITTSGTAMDEIYFEAEIGRYAGTTYIFKGHKRSGFLQDENPNYE